MILNGTTTKISLFHDEKKQYVHVFYNGIEAEKEKTIINKRFANMDEELEELNSKKIKQKEDEIKELINKTGYYCIVTSKEMSAKKAVKKIFRMEKSYLENDVSRVHSDEKLEGKLFVSFIALIIRNEIYKSLKELYKGNRKEYTVPKVLREYEK